VAPRSYKLGRRQATSGENRRRIVAAARRLLAQPRGVSAFTVDAVARQAGVARMTVYYQFGSKAGLIEALFDELAGKGGLDRLPLAFRQPDPRQALEDFISAFCKFWASDKVVIGRLQALAVIDPALAQASRESRRRQGLSVLLGRLGKDSPEVIDLLQALTCYQVFAVLAQGKRDSQAIARLLIRTAWLTLDA